MRRFPIQLFSTLSMLTILMAIAPSSLAANRSPRRIAAVDQPICYVQLAGQSMLNLNGLCGVGTPKSSGGVIDLSLDADGDGVPDQLLAEMKKFRAEMSQAKSSADYRAALQKLESRLPYSDNVKQLQAEQRALQKQLQNRTGGGQNREIYRKLSSIQSKIYKDPSYTKVQKQMSKVYRKLNT
ncbi:hypothetical protein IQ266_09205 [filamentous cyanobacterium LEGE 11480]|uniref:Uncharacterized protein n=1 Tax=Romeriopsis navalis LEGE 11480 TaxID=2777977 RepID=A0A928VLG0_9CYAN|nr:hypothetical protein [Romeriopsis navalis]MBE9029903.1 hypothetical protein [Romeriopsis navalis LEGE 11480]